MGHFITGLIAEPQLLPSFASQKSLHRPVALNHGLGFLPLRDEDIDSFTAPPQTGYPEGFNYLSEQLATEIARASQDGVIVYIETEYFGGTGSQGAALFENGALTYGPKSAELGPINEALRMIGVTSDASAVDEFEAVGLTRHRSNADWLDLEN
jgi:hypothetical protein